MTIRELFENEKWTFAKTYAKTAPHEYIVRGKTVLSDYEFDELVATILEEGFPAYFYSRVYRYLYIGGFFYWCISEEESIEDAIIINRCPEDWMQLRIVRQWVEAE